MCFMASDQEGFGEMKMEKELLTKFIDFKTYEIQREHEPTILHIPRDITNSEIDYLISVLQSYKKFSEKV